YPTNSVDTARMLAAARRQMTNVLAAARSTGVERAVYTSSLSTIGPPRRADGLATEEDLYSPGLARHPYWEIKWAQEEIARRFAAEGLPVIILNPTAVFGPGDVKPTTGRVVIAAVRSRCRFYPDLRTNVIDVRDVAQAHLAASEHGRSGERYILGAYNITGREQVAALAEVEGLPPPSFKIPLPGWLFGPARLLEHGLYRLAPQARFLVPTQAMEFQRLGGWYDSSKAEQELGLRASRTLVETMRDTVAWFRQNGYL
ncbi:MAG: NAD-dependent epimerase/dehydratase family protein, partial [Anaerolineae bacterium]|nr:NAD-dependent epimerase/dehydratase family protein [Anaerolineae bacterium]